MYVYLSDHSEADLMKLQQPLKYGLLCGLPTSFVLAIGFPMVGRHDADASYLGLLLDGTYWYLPSF